jgi:hypothetical protein
MTVHGSSILRQLIVLVAICGVLAGCAKKEQSFTTGETIPAQNLPLLGFRGDTAYSVVQSSALPAMFADFKSVLFKQGLVKWDSRFDCNHFASLYIGLAQAQYAAAAWHSSTPAQTLALAEFWYRPNPAINAGHAIVAAQTERGLLFIEPQTGREVALNAAQINSAYLVKW